MKMKTLGIITLIIVAAGIALLVASNSLYPAMNGIQPEANLICKMVGLLAAGGAIWNYIREFVRCYRKVSKEAKKKAR